MDMIVFSMQISISRAAVYILLACSLASFLLLSAQSEKNPAVLDRYDWPVYGGTPDNILKITFWMKEPGTGRAALNDEWVKMFPDPASRPARHTTALGSESNALVTCEFVAVFG